MLWIWSKTEHTLSIADIARSYTPISLLVKITVLFEVTIDYLLRDDVPIKLVAS